MDQIRRPSSQAVFISYASQDGEAASHIGEALRSAGIDVWFDRSELRGGDAWDHQIHERIRDCRLFVAIISANTEARDEGYFRREWKLAVDRTHEMEEHKAFLVPIAIDDTPERGAAVPEKFREVQWTRLPGGSTPPTFVERIRQMLVPTEDRSGALVRAASGAPSAPNLAAVMAAHSAVPENSIAVLPFTNLGGDADKEYFSEGLAEEILTALSQVEDLRVAARSSAFSFKGKTTDIAEIANKLHVANVLEGSVRRGGNRIRVTVQLVDALNGFLVWSERYDRQMEDIFELQDDIARAIAERLKVTLGAGAMRTTLNVEAYELYLKGRHYWHQRTAASMRAAIQCFEHSVKLDPNYPMPYTGLADAYGVLQFYGWMPADATRPAAHAAVMRAFALAPALSEVNFSRAFHILVFGRAWQEAEPFFKKCLATNPRSSLGHVYYGGFLNAQGRTDAALEHVRLACEIDPLSPSILSNAALVLWTTERFSEANNLVERALALDANNLLASYVGSVMLCFLGRHDEAIAKAERSVGLSRTPLSVGFLGNIYGFSGRTADAAHVLRELEDRASRGEYIPAQALLCYWIGQRDPAGVREALSKAQVDSMSGVFVRMIGGAVLESLRTDPEINRLHLELLGW